MVSVFLNVSAARERIHITGRIPLPYPEALTLVTRPWGLFWPSVEDAWFASKVVSQAHTDELD